MQILSSFLKTINMMVEEAYMYADAMMVVKEVNIERKES